MGGVCSLGYGDIKGVDFPHFPSSLCVGRRSMFKAPPGCFIAGDASLRDFRKEANALLS
jgi:hypothetical protein